jgi:hypothetical protein
MGKIPDFPKIQLQARPSRHFPGLQKRIQELKQHHQDRLDEIVSILEKSKMNAFRVASKMTWDIVSDSCDVFPISQKWFATGEAIAHLKYLRKRESSEAKSGTRRSCFS